MTAPALSVQDLSVDLKVNGQFAPIVRNVSFDITRGETLALVGESGSGKTITALSVMRLLPENLARCPTGHIHFRDQDLARVPQRDLLDLRGHRISMIFQDPLSALNPLHTIGKQIAEVIRQHEGGRPVDIRARTVDLLQRVGLPDPERMLRSFPHQLSGGQRQRVMIAMMIANRPDVLIADEPTTALDVTVQAQILNLLIDLRKEFGMAILIITHDLTIVRKIADRVCVMTQGEIVEQGKTTDVLTNPQHPYTRHLLSAENPGPGWQPVGEAAPFLSVEGLRVWHPVKGGLLGRTVGHVKAVDDVSFTIGRGETLAVVGESGSGKTTLGLALLGLVSSEGSVAYDGQALQGLSGRALRALRKDIQIVFQDPYGALSPRLSVGESILEGPDVHGGAPAGKAARRAFVGEVLEEVGLSADMQDRYPHEFSGGQRQRIAIARALVLKPRFIVLDEPTSALDMSVQAQVIRLLLDLQQRHGLAYLFISHDLRTVRAMATRVLVMKEGNVVETGAVADILDRPRAPYTRALVSAAFGPGEAGG